MNLSKVISNVIFKFEKLLVIILIPIMLIAMVLDIFFRYFLSSPLMWGQELALYSFVWTSFIGASMSIKSKGAVAVTVLVDRINTKLSNALIAIGLFVSTVFSIYIFYLSINWITNPTIFLQTSVTTQTPMIYMYMSIPVSLLFMTIHFINWLFEALRSVKNGKVIE
ncbi:TRAP-type C4-dicarboxylate transport system, small permease component [Lentibacillus persicus]|uniref:TRAP-type C4-dicarboxylate transport system, small permease component n=1 Tax=Lentibacillus persicus TaxID=640948 RepID=A0A1I2A472_9BACI|nr:TRAP transporter small permease [Lentibacillus persicus]SFE38752.1 TRAP-type C4-dicarboxylate transport system, small permease component [Lentibacillus persicus]